MFTIILHCCRDIYTKKLQTNTTQLKQIYKLYQNAKHRLLIEMINPKSVFYSFGNTKLQQCFVKDLLNNFTKLSIDSLMLLNTLVYYQIEQLNQQSMLQLMQKDQNKYNSALRLIRSEQLTPEMAINYLYHWRINEVLLPAILERIEQFFKRGFYHLVPTAIFIMSLQKNKQLQKFCQNLCKQSLSCYLLLRWSYSTYLQQTEKAKNRLDNCILETNSNLEELGFDIKLLEKYIKQKQIKLNYTTLLNQYYEKLFEIPEKLKEQQKPNRNKVLREKLLKLHTKFVDKMPEKKAIQLPLQQTSSLVVDVCYDYCLTFSTKERVPFKVVFETISEQDFICHKTGAKYTPKQEQVILDKKKSLILPQSYFGPEWKQECIKIASRSPYSTYDSYLIRSFIIKSGDDIRQQHMAMQLISMIQQICKKQNVKIWLKTYSVIPFDQESGLIQFVEDTKTVSYLKEKSKATTLSEVYRHLFGSNWQASITNFVQSLAGYSVVQYLFQIKDRHNNNILIDSDGHIIHIDFSFILSSSPGNMNFEKSPFKLTKDYLQLMDGEDSDIFHYFKNLFFFALKYIRNYKRQIMQRVEMMAQCKNMKCFYKYNSEQLASRFLQGTTDEELMENVERLVKEAIKSYTTGHYDKYQWLTNYIYS